MSISVPWRVALLSMLIRGRLAVEPAALSLLQTRARWQSVTCPIGVQDLEAKPKASVGVAADMNRVVLADFPSTGSSWLRSVLGKSVQPLADVPNPACAIYQESPSMVKSFEDVYCPEGWTRDAGAALFKTHYPAQELFNNDDLADWQYDASMHFDKIVLLLRHPVSTVVSNNARWGGTFSHLGTCLSCWAAWWRRAMDAVGSENVLVVRYEDLCLDLAGEVERVFRFLDGAYADVTMAHVQAALADDRDLSCLYSATQLQQQAASFLSSMILPHIDDFFWNYNYTSTSVKMSAVSEALGPSALSRGSGSEARHEQGLNPWLGIWPPDVSSWTPG